VETCLLRQSVATDMVMKSGIVCNDARSLDDVRHCSSHTAYQRSFRFRLLLLLVLLVLLLSVLLLCVCVLIY